MRGEKDSVVRGSRNDRAGERSSGVNLPLSQVKRNAEHVGDTSKLSSHEAALSDKALFDEASLNKGLLDQAVLEKAVSDPAISVAIAMMMRARDYAVDCNLRPWEFAVEISDLQKAGVSNDEIRWLVGKGLVEHAVEIPGNRQTGRAFEPIGGFGFDQRSCFVLSRLGIEIAAQLPTIRTNDSPSQNLAATHAGETDMPSPTWDCERHELKIGKVIVKRFKWRATNQEAILNAFQEENWPPRIDDPLPPKPEKDPKRRLSDAIKCLNRKQDNPLIRFRGDGTGEGVLWSFVESDTQ